MGPPWLRAAFLRRCARSRLAEGRHAASPGSGHLN
jgi:hypothetical protein